MLPFALVIGFLLLLPAPQSLAAQPAGKDTSSTGATGSGPVVGRAEVGIPFPSNHYPPSAYGHGSQNWAVTQDRRGLIYVANTDGVLQYDGENWRLIPAQDRKIARSLAADSLVYVGWKGDFGVLRRDSVGTLRYHSLTPHIPQEAKDFGDVWNTSVLENEAYFQSSKRLFRWDGSTVRVWNSETEFHTSFAVDGTFYVQERERGLLEMSDDSLVFMPGGRSFSDTSIRMMAPHPSGDILVATEQRGLFLLDERGGRRLRRGLRPETAAYLTRHGLYHGCRLPGDRYALATLGGGTVVIDAQGRLSRVFDNTSGLPDEVVNYVFPGREGELWMALNNDGIYRTSLSVSATLFDERSGLSGTIEDLHRHQGMVYAATGSGLYVLRDTPSARRKRPQFVKRGGLPLAWDLLSVGSDLLAATEKGVYQVNGNEIIGRQAYVLARSDSSQTIYAGLKTGLAILRRGNGTWESSRVGNIDAEIRSLIVESGEHMWAATMDGDIIRLALSEDGRQVSEMHLFDETSGLPSGYKSPLLIDGEIAIRSRGGLFRLSNPQAPPRSWNFTPDTSFLPTVDRVDTLAVKALVKEDSGPFWAALGDRVFRGMPAPGDSVHWTEIRSLRFPKSGGATFYTWDQNTLWLGTGQRLIRYAPTEDRQSRSFPPFRALIRRVATLPAERIVYDGARAASSTSLSLTLPYSSNDFRVEVAAPLYDTASRPEYQYRLAGHTGGWTDWTSRPSITFSNLWEGTYRFQVRARSAAGRVSQAGTLTLTLRPPWYRSTWAYLLYGFGTVLLLLGFRHYYQVNRERLRAQRQVAELEEERKARQKLRRANERLREANQLKENFLANTSHELRTPLTNILGFVDVLEDTATSEQKRFLEAIEKNGRRLERTLNALLELSRLRSGSEVPDAEPTAVGGRIRRLVPELREAAEEKGLTLHVDLPPEDVYAEADERYLDQILSNLIENAIKFTEEGYVRVSACAADEWVKIDVEDTGIGIDEEFLPRLFEDFEQESRGRSRSYEGYGLGLAISSRLAKRMNGRIEVESTKGEGSTFTLLLPLAPQMSSSSSQPS